MQIKILCFDSFECKIYGKEDMMNEFCKDVNYNAFKTLRMIQYNTIWLHELLLHPKWIFFDDTTSWMKCRIFEHIKHCARWWIVPIDKVSFAEINRKKNIHFSLKIKNIFRSNIYHTCSNIIKTLNGIYDIRRPVSLKW